MTSSAASAVDIRCAIVTDVRPRVSGYKLDDLVAALNAVAPHDWKGHLMRRVGVPTESPPLDGITPAYLSHQFRASTATTTRELSWAYSAGLTLALLHVTLIVPPLGREAAPISE